MNKKYFKKSYPYTTFFHIAYFFSIIPLQSMITHQRYSSYNNNVIVESIFSKTNNYSYTLLKKIQKNRSGSQEIYRIIKSTKNLNQPYRSRKNPKNLKSPLEFASLNHMPDLLQKLIALGANPDHIINKTKYSALHLAVASPPDLNEKYYTVPCDILIRGGINTQAKDFANTSVIDIIQPWSEYLSNKQLSFYTIIKKQLKLTEQECARLNKLFHNKKPLKEKKDLNKEIYYNAFMNNIIRAARKNEIERFQYFLMNTPKTLYPLVKENIIGQAHYKIIRSLLLKIKNKKNHAALLSSSLKRFMRNDDQKGAHALCIEQEAYGIAKVFARKKFVKTMYFAYIFRYKKTLQKQALYEPEIVKNIIEYNYPKITSGT